MARYKKMWKFIPLLILPSAIIYFFFGSVRWAILSLGLIPLFVMGWEMCLVYFSREGRLVREIWKHMTFAERDHMRRLILAWGSKCGVLLGTALTLVVFALGFILEVEDSVYWILAFLVVSAIEIPFHMRTQKPLIYFAFTTKYAKEKGWSQDSIEAS